MRSSTLCAAMALLASSMTVSSLSRMPAGDARPGEPTVLAQATTGNAGSNSPASGAGPRTEVAPGSTDGTPASAKRTSKDFGSGQPLAGDEKDHRRPNADSAPSGHGSMPHPSPGAGH